MHCFVLLCTILTAGPGLAALVTLVAAKLIAATDVRLGVATVQTTEVLGGLDDE